MFTKKKYKYLVLQRCLVNSDILGGNLTDEVGVDLAVLDVGPEVGDVPLRTSLNITF